MIVASISRRIARTASRFVRAKEGNIAVTFAIASVPLFCFVGAAIDYSRAATARTAMQAALDSTVLMVAKDLSAGVVQPANVNTAANSYFQGLFASYTTTNHRDAYVDSVSATYTASSGSSPATISATANGHVDTVFMRAAGLLVPGGPGFPIMSFGTSSTSTWGNVKMRVALVLDNTGSMAQNNKIAALRTAVAGSGGLIDQLSALSHNSGDVYISIVPFAKVVNLPSGFSQSNIDWTDWLNPPTAQPNNHAYQATLPMNWHAVGPGAKCPFSNNSGGFYCTTSPVTGSSVSGSQNANVVPASGAYSGYICPSVDANSHTFYNGCWTSTPASPSSGVFCSGSSSCSCPTTPSGSTVTGCSCTGSGSNKSCTGNLYDHKWTQPSVVAPVGFTSNRWTSTNSTPTVANNYTGTSTNPTSTWTGCVTDRTQPNDASSVQPSGDVTTQFPANQYGEGNGKGYCDSSSNPQLEPIIPLSQSWTTLKSAINAMQPTGGTDQAIGLAWGWQSLIPGGVLNAPAEDANTTYNRVIILLSDGLNTEDRWPDYGDGSTQQTGSGDAQFPGKIDARQRILCDNLKNARDAQNRPMYTIYTIQANTATPADPTSAILQYCASSPDKFYELTNSNQIITTFQSIGTALSKLRVAM
jgi:Flp pilus assembly protein TadG